MMRRLHPPMRQAVAAWLALALSVGLLTTVAPVAGAGVVPAGGAPASLRAAAADRIRVGSAVEGVHRSKGLARPQARLPHARRPAGDRRLTDGAAAFECRADGPL